MSENKHAIKNENYLYGLIPVEVMFTKEEAVEILKEFPAPSLPAKEKTFEIEKANDGDSFENLTAIIGNVVLMETNGAKPKPYLKFKVTTNNRTIDAKMWDRNGSVKKAFEFFEENKVVCLKGKINEYAGNKGLIIEGYEKTKEEINPFHLLPTTEKNIKLMIVELVSYINQLTEPHKSIAKSCLTKFWRDFCIKPAAKGFHHAFIGGLLEHTLGLVRISYYLTKKRSNDLPEAMDELIEGVFKEHRKQILKTKDQEETFSYRKMVWAEMIEHFCESMGKYIEATKKQELNSDLLIASIVWHDLAKSFEYTHAGDHNKHRLIFNQASNIDEFDQKVKENEPMIGMDPLGKLVGHIPLGMMLFDQTIKEQKTNLSVEDYYEYLHCIASHHGKKEWGSPTLPVTPAAILLNFVDCLDARFCTMN